LNLNFKLYFSTPLLVLSAYVSASENELVIGKTEIKQCELVQYGTLNLKTIGFENSKLNSYLLNCSLLSVVAMHNESNQSVKASLKKKQDIASVFLSKKLNVDYKDNDGTTLLMSIVLSNLQTEWKVNAIKLLVSKGGNLNAKNIYGKTAQDLAEFKKDKKIVDLISSLN